jgi:NADH:ubiquinone oxidoreductase subunit 3 (subunit A)
MLFIFVPVLIVILLALNLLFASHRPDAEKISPFECGFSPIFGQTRSPFHIQFYLVAILFLVFDLEIFYLVPFCVTMYQISSYGFSIFVIFFIVLTIGFVYELGAKILYFGNQRSKSNKNIS